MNPKNPASALAVCSIATLGGCGKANEIIGNRKRTHPFHQQMRRPIHQKAQAAGGQISLEKFQAVCALAYGKIAQTQETAAWVKAVASYNKGNYVDEVMTPMSPAIAACSQQLLP